MSFFFSEMKPACFWELKLCGQKSKISSSIGTSSPLLNRDYGVIKSGVTYIVDVVGVGAICKTV